MSAYKIFISSPGDVGRERHLAEQVIRRIAAEFQGRVEVQPYFWEYEPMESTRDYQENIPLTSDFDLVICILWKRLGSPLSVKHQRPGGGRWRSGTEFELATAFEAKKARGVPDIFIFKNDTRPTFEADEDGGGAKTEVELAQWKALIAFIKEWCEREEDGQRVFTVALNRYQALDQFEQVLEKLLRRDLNERFPTPSESSGGEVRGLRAPAPTWTEGSPFRGLEAFHFVHAPVFSGRTRAIGEVLDRLRRKAAQGRPFILILGASGSGKTSLAMAGVLPLLVKPGTIEGVGLWRRVVFRPGGQKEAGDLFDLLATALVRRQQEGEGLPELISGSTTIERLAVELRADPKAAALLVRSALNQVAALYREAEAQKIRSWIAESQSENRTADVERYGRLLTDLTAREARLALVIDQAEELFTADDLNRRPELREGFAVALNALATSGVVFVLATLRSDFYSQIQQLSAFVDLKEADGQFDLLPPQPAEIAQMIRQPAIAAGLRFEKDPQTQEGLDEVLADQVKAEPRLLPLLEFALDELYKQRTADGLLTFEAYRVYLDGSIVRALAKRADATLEGLPVPSRDAFRSVMRRLATMVDDTAAGSAKGPQLDVIEGPRRSTFQRQRVPYDQLTAHPPEAKALVDAFVAARLLVVERGKADDRKAEVTVAHEALFEYWAALKNLLLAERDDLILPRARVAASHERWLAENQAGDFLLPPGKQLNEAEHLLAQYGEELTPELKAYVAASMAQAHAQQKRRQRLLVGASLAFALLAVVTTAVAVYGFRKKGEAEEQTRTAIEQRAEAKKTLSRSDFATAGALPEEEAIAYLSRSIREWSDNWQSGELLMSKLVESFGSTSRSLRLDHSSGVNTAAFSPDFSRIVTASDDHTARIWDAETGRSIGQALKHEDGVYSAVFSPDGSRIVTTSEDHTARIWDAATGRAIGQQLQHDGSVRSAAFSPDALRIVTASDDYTARIWIVATCQEVGWRLNHKGPVSSAVFSPDGSRIVTTSEDHTARIWDSATGRAIGQQLQHDGSVRSAAFSPDASRIVTASDDYTARIWDAKTGHPIGQALRHGGPVNSALFRADGQQIVTSSEDQTAAIWDAQSGEPHGNPFQEDAAVLYAVFSPNGTGLAIASKDGTVNIAAGGTERIVQHDEAVPFGAFSGDGKRIVTASLDGTARVWEISPGSPLGQPLQHEDVVTSVAYSRDGSRIVTASSDNTARIWEASTGREIGHPLRHKRAVNSAAFSRDGKYVITASSDNTAQVWDSTTCEAIGSALPHENAVNSAAFSPDDRAITASSDMAQIWDVRTGKPACKPLKHEDRVNCARFSPDGSRIVTASEDTTARIWNSVTGEEIGQPLRHKNAVNSAAFSPNGQFVVTASDKTAQIWEVSTGTAKGQALRHEGNVRSAEFSPDGRNVLTASEDGSAIIWDAATGDVGAKLLSSTDDYRTTKLHLAAYSPDGRRILTVSEKAVEVWDASTGRALRKPLWHQGEVQFAIFSPDGQRIATACSDFTGRIWDTFTSSTAPEWLGRFAEAIGQLRLDDASGRMVRSSGRLRDPDSLFKIIPADADRREAIGSNNGRDVYATTARWLLTPLSLRRPISPFSSMTMEEFVIQRVINGGKFGAQEALEAFPYHPLCLLAAPAPTFFAVQDYSWLRAYALSLPNSAASVEGWRQCAELLKRQNHPREAAIALKKAALLKGR